MITRLPSNQRQYDLVWSHDAAFVQLPELAKNATDEQKEAYKKLVESHEAKWKVARETGDYSALKVEGGPAPTIFTMKQLTHDQMAFLFDLTRSGAFGEAEVNSLAFLSALSSVTNLGDVTVKPTQHVRLGQIASSSFFTEAGVPANVSVAVTMQLGQLVFERMASLSKT